MKVKVHKRKGVKELLLKAKVLLLIVAVLIGGLQLQGISQDNQVHAATGEKKTIMIGAVGVANFAPPLYTADTNDGWHGDYLYMGGDHRYDDPLPLPWRILNTHSTEFGNPGILLYSDLSIKLTYFSYGNYNTYDASNVENECIIGFNNNTTPAEKDATFSSTNTDEYEFQGQNSDIKFRDLKFSNQNWFLATGKMVNSTAYGFSTSNYDKTRLYDALLASGRVGSTDVAVTGSKGWNIVPHSCYNNGTQTAEGRWLHPASVIDPNKILLVSKAEGGKESAADGTLTSSKAITDDYNDWKMTLIDGQQAITKHTATRTAKDKVEVTLSKIGEGTSISAVVTDESEKNIMYYGRVASVAGGAVADTKATITLPEDFDAKKYKLKLFTELYAGDKKTDSASAFVDVDFPGYMVPITIGYYGADGSIKVDNTTFKDVEKNTNVEAKILDHIYNTLPLPAGKRFAKGEEKVYDIDPATGAGDLTNVQGPLTVTVKYYTTNDITVKYLNQDHTENIELLKVDSGDAVPLPEPDDTFDEIDGKKYRYIRDGNGKILWDTTENGDVTNVQNSFTVTAQRIEQFETKIRVRNTTEEKWDAYTTHWMDKASAIVDKLPTLTEQAKGYRVTYFGQDVSKIWQLSSTTSTLSNIQAPTTVEPIYTKTWEVRFHDEQGAVLDNGTGTQVLYVDSGGFVKGSDQAIPPAKAFHNFFGWKDGSGNSVNLETVTKDLDLHPIYNPQNIEIRTDRPLDVVKTSEAITTFGPMTNDEIHGKLLSMYNPRIWRDGMLTESTKGITIQLQAGDYDKLRSGVVGGYTVTINYQDITEESIKAQSSVTFRITDEAKEEITSNGKLAANDFAISTAEAEILSAVHVFFTDRAGAIAFDQSGQKQTVFVDKTTLTDIQTTPGIYTIKMYATLDGQKVEIPVKVQVKDSAAGEVTTTGQKELLHANNVAIAKESVEGLDDDTLIKLAQAKASYMETGTSIAGITVRGIPSIEAKRGVYSVSFTTPGGTTTPISVMVKDQASEGADPDTGYRISASDFSIGIDEVAGLNNDKLIATANAQATKISDHSKGAITVDYSAITAEKGTYPVTFKAPDTTAVTVQATVVDQADEKGQERISASDFVISMSEAANPTADGLIAKGEVKAWNTATGADVAITVDSSQLKGEKGAYPVTFSTASGASISVMVRVTNIFIEENDIRMEGNNVTLTKAQAMAIDEAGLLKASGVRASVMSTHTEIKDLTMVGLEAVNKGIGNHPVEITATHPTSDLTATLTIQVEVRDVSVDNPDPEIKEHISGNHFGIGVAEAASLTDGDLVARGQVKAINTETSAAVEVKVTNKGGLKAEKGIYEITYATDNGTALTLQVKVGDEMAETNETIITGNHFTLTTEEATNFSEAELITRGQVNAINQADGAQVAVKVSDKTNLKGTPGVYEVSFASDNADAAAITLKASVKEHGIVNPDTGESISANDILVAKEQVTLLDQDMLIALAGAKAYEVDSGADVAIATATHTAVAKKGAYTATFETAKGTTMDVTLMVTDNATSDPEKGEMISAANFAMSLEELKTANSDGTLEEVMKAKSKVKAVDLNTGEVLDVTVDTSNVAMKKGIYDVVFATAKHTKTTAKVEVKDQVAENPDENIKEQITANDFTIQLEEVDGLTEDRIKKLAKVKAEHTQTGEALEVTISNNTITKAVGRYEVEFKTANETKISIYVNVKEQGVTDNETKESIYASDFTLSLDEAKTPTKDFLVARANALARDQEGNEVDITTAMTAMTASKGIYDVTFATAKGTSITVQAEVQDKVNGNDDPAIHEVISGNDFRIASDEVTGLDEAELKAKALEKSKVKAFNTDTGADVPVTVTSIGGLADTPGAYTITFATANGTTLEVMATVNEKEGTNPDTKIKEAIYANSFTLPSNEVVHLELEDAIEKANAIAINTQTQNEVAITSATLDALSPNPGVYQVTFATAKGTSVEVDVTVQQDSVENIPDNEVIFSSDFTISKDQAQTLLDANAAERNAALIAYARASAKALQAPEAPIDVQVKNHTIEAKQGIYDVVFQTETGKTEITSKVMVTQSGGSGEVIDPEDPDGGTIKEYIMANDFSVSLDEASKGLTPTQLIKLAKASAMTEKGNKVKVGVDDNKIEAKKGVYDVTFKTDAGTSVTVKATVTDGSAGGNVDPDVAHRIYANDFSLSVAEAKDITAAKAIELAGAKAYDKASGAPVKVSVDVAQIKGKGQGRYEVTYTTAQTSITVTATVMKSGGSGEIPNPEDPDGPAYHEQITANDFTIAKDKVASVTDAQMIALANANAVIVETGEEVPIKVTKKMPAKKGIHQVTFEASGGTSVTVKARVTDHVAEDDTKTDIISANHFSLSVAEAKTITAEKAIAFAHAYAYDTVTSEEVAVTMDDLNAIKNKPQGNYTVGFTSANGATIKVTATVTSSGTSGEVVDPSDPTDPDKNYSVRLNANDFSIDKDKVGVLTDSKVIALANATAVNETTGAHVDIKVDSKLKAEKGIYDVTFQHEASGISVTVKGTVVDNGAGDNTNPSVAHSIYANDFSISQADAKAVTSEGLVKLANAKAYDKASGAPVKVSVDVAQVKGKTQGRYPVTFTTGKTSLRVYANITGGSATNPDVTIKETIYANDFTIGVKDAQKVSEATLVQLANASAVNTQTGADVKVTVKENTIKGQKAGTYKVTFETAKGTKITVKGTIEEKGIIDDKTGESITAHDFTVSAKEAKSMTSKDIIAKAGAKGTDLATGGNVALTVSGKLGTGGKATITFATKKGTSLGITATVLPEDPGKPGDGGNTGNGGDDSNTGNGGGDNNSGNGGDSGNTGNGGNSGDTENGGNTNTPSIDKPVVNPDGSIDIGGGTVIKPSPDGDKPTINPDGTITIPEGGKVTVGDNEFIFKDGGMMGTDRIMRVKAGSTVIINGTEVYFKDGGIIRLDGTYDMSKEDAKNTKGRAKDATKDAAKGATATDAVTKQGIRLPNFLLPLWMLLYAVGYYVIQRKKKED